MPHAQLEAMPRHDPIPRRPERPVEGRRSGPPERRSAEWARFISIMGWMAIVAITAVLLSLIYLKASDAVSIHMQIATILGVFFTIMLGTGLMGLVFLSNRCGHDDDATYGDWND
jgi:hypothetical protein